MTADPDTSATAILAGIKADHEAANAFGPNAGDPIPRLVAAIEAVLGLANGWEGRGAGRHVTRGYAAECFRAAITRELSGKDSTKGEGTGDG
jgi:hypothetical protein